MSAPEPPPPPAPPASPSGPARPGRLRRFVVRPFVWGLVLLVALVVGLYYLIGSRLIQERFTAFAIAQATDFFNRPVKVAGLEYSLFPLAVELRGVVIPGPTPKDPPFATAELLRIQIPWGYLRQRIVRLDQVDAIHPTLFLEFRPDGSTNLPHFRSQGGGGQSRFQLQIGRLLVQRGEFRLNQRRVAFDLAARSIWGRLNGPRPTHLDGLVTAQEVVTSLPDGHPYPATVSGKVILLADRGLLRIPAVRLAGADLKANASGWVSWKGATRVEIQFDATGDARLVNHLGYLDAPLVGPFQVAGGRFSLTNEDWSFAGTATAPRVDFLGRTATAVAGRARGDAKRVHVDVQRATYAGGAAQGTVEVDLATVATPTHPGRPVDLAFDFRGVSIETALAAEQVPIAGLSGEGSGRFTYRFNSAAPLAGSGRANVTLAGRYPATGLPLSGEVPLVFERGVLTSPAIQLTAPGQNATGTLSVDVAAKTGRIDFQLASQDAGPVMRMIPADPGPPAFWRVTAGHGQATGSFGFSPAGLVIDLGLDLADVRSPDPAIVADTVRGTLRVAPRAVENLRLELTQGRGRLAVAGRVPIPGDRPKVPLDDPLTLVVDTVDWPAASIAGYLYPGLPLSISGLVTCRIDLSGSAKSLSSDHTARVTDLVLGGFPLGQARTDVIFDGTVVRLENGVVETPAGKALVQGTFDTAAKAFSFTLDAPALSLTAPPLRDLLPGIGGEVSLAASLDGSPDHPQAMVSARGQGLEIAGRTLGDEGRAELSATWDFAAVRAAGSLLGLVTFDGGGRLDSDGAAVSFNLKSDNLPGLAQLAAQRPLPAFTGALAGQVTAAADFAAKSYRAELTLSDLTARMEGHEIKNVEPVVVVLDPERITLRSFYLREADHGTELFAGGTVGLAGRRPLDLHLQSTIWAGWSKLFSSDFDLDGYVDTLVTVRGTLADPAASGEAVLRDARLIVPGLPSTFDHLEGEARFSGDRIELETLTATFAGGTVRASGWMNLPEPRKPLDYNASLFARGVSIRYPEGFVNHGNADLFLAPTEGGGRSLRGSVDLDRIYYLEDVQVETLDLVKKLFQRSRLQVTPTNGFLAATQVNVAVNGKGALRVHDNVADLHGDVGLTVRGSLARPVVLGSVQIDTGGKLVYADNQYRVERGQLTFDNAYKIDPVLDFVVRTRVRDFEITVNFSGTLERPVANFSSNANLADLEIVALLATGQELREEDRLRALTAAPGQIPQSTQPNVSAGSILAGQAASALGQRVSTLFGFDRFRINPIAAETGQSVGGVGVTVGKRLSKDVFVTYSTDPTASRQNVLQVEWQVASNVTLLLTQTTNKGYAVDARWERRF
ncbi:MAG TPA: translocation/assembly module TamB domain-containing protein [Thermoanaerobaculia bacterium]|nr:translocation/assembly module TamB domain-containing protein [Thermoanaerobaculia bacterium]